MTTTDFSAKEPALGYFYQIRYALYLLLKKSKDNANSCIRIECLDDIEVGEVDKSNLFQTKLHLKTKADLTDRSTDFWKTIRVWSDSVAKSLIDLNNTTFTLITTSSVSESSFIFKIKSGEDLDDVLRSMLEICKESSNQNNLDAYTAFKALGTTQQQSLLTNMHIIDSSLSIDETLSEIKKELIFSAIPEHLDAFSQRLEGWWFQQAIQHLCSNTDSILSVSLLTEISNIRDSFQKDNLPDDFPEPIETTDSDIFNYLEETFVKQLSLIDIKSNALRAAISNYRTTFEQRSKWIKDNLTDISEFEKFDKKLQRHWNEIFSLIKDDSEGANDAELSKMGRDFYIQYFVRTVPPYSIRDRFQSDFFTRGSCHILSNEKKIGWHPKFDELL